jgi:hypothetical protein
MFTESAEAYGVTGTHAVYEWLPGANNSTEH